MGWERKDKTLRLVFEDPEYEGLEVVTRRVPLETFLRLARLQDSSGIDEVAGLINDFAEAALVSWNLEQNGEPIPVTAEAFRSQDFEFAMVIIRAWLNAVAAVPVPLDKPSQNGESPAELSIPMVPLSGSPPS